MKEKMKVKKIFLIIWAFFFIFFAQSCGFVKVIDDSELSGTDSAEEQTNTLDVQEITSAELPVTEPQSEPPTEKVLAVHPKFDELLSLNQDVVGYIKIDNTVINFPVVFNGDNEYYLKHDFYGNDDKYGTVFMDMNNHGSILDRNTILHGHNFGDGLFFNDLEKFKQKDFFSENNKIIFGNLYSDMEWEVFSVYVIHANEYFLRTSFTSDEEYLDFLTKIKEASIFQTDYIPSASDYILSLNTCSFEYDEAHTIIHARLVKKTDNWQN